MDLTPALLLLSASRILVSISSFSETVKVKANVQSVSPYVLHTPNADIWVSFPRFFFFFFLSFYIFSGVGGACATESVWRLEDDFQ